MKNEIPDRSLDNGESAPVAAYTDPAYRDDSDEYLLNDIGLALRLRGEWH